MTTCDYDLDTFSFALLIPTIPALTDTLYFYSALFPFRLFLCTFTTASPHSLGYDS